MCAISVENNIMTYTVEIDRSSIKKNKNGGSTTSDILVGVETKVTFNSNVPKFVENNPKWLWSGTECQDSSIIAMYYVSDPNEVKKLVESKTPCQIERTSKLQTYSHFPTPLYSYEYKTVQVECMYCDAKFNSSKLRADGLNGEYSATICPVCFAWDCCDLEYEKIEDVLQAKNLQVC